MGDVVQFRSVLNKAFDMFLRLYGKDEAVAWLSVKIHNLTRREG
jgi:hypothetical protein